MRHVNQTGETETETVKFICGEERKKEDLAAAALHLDGQP